MNLKTPKKVPINFKHLQDFDLSDNLISDQPNEVEMIDIKCGGSHSMVLTDDRFVYVCGYNSQG